MAAIILQGKTLSREIRASLVPRIESLRRSMSRAPTLAIIAADDRPVVSSYLRSKIKACAAIGIETAVHGLPAIEGGAHSLIRKLGKDASVDGIIVVRPFPSGFSVRGISEVIPTEKDAEGMNPSHFGELFLAKTYEEASSGILPCTARAVVEVLRSTGIDPVGRSAVVIGRSNILGKPAAHLLGTLDATVTLCHSRTPGLEDRVRQADIVVACFGRPRFVQAGWLKPGAIVLDAGVNSTASGLVGDVDYEPACKIASHITPVPGGIGPVTTAILLSNVVRLAELALER